MLCSFGRFKVGLKDLSLVPKRAFFFDPFGMFSSLFENLPPTTTITTKKLLLGTSSVSFGQKTLVLTITAHNSRILFLSKTK